MASLSAARKAALHLVSAVRRRSARVRDLAREDAALAALQPADRALAMRLAVGVTSAWAVLDQLIDRYVKRPSSVEPRVRDALRLATFEVCYLDTPSAASVSQGVELVRSVTPRAAGMANAILRKLVAHQRPRIDAARATVSDAALGLCDVTPEELSLAAGIPAWLCKRLLEERGAHHAALLGACQLEPAPVVVATHGLRHSASELERILAEANMQPEAVEGLPGSFALGNPAPLAASGLVERTDVAVSDVSAQLVCRLAAPEVEGDVLEIGQGRGTKSLLLATACDAVHPRAIVGIDTVPYKVRVTQRRMRAAGLEHTVSSLVFDACKLDEANLPVQLARTFDAVLVDAPCSGTGTMRRHPEICADLEPRDVHELAALQLRMLTAAASRVAVGGVLTYATCSVLHDEDEAVVQAFLASEVGKAFVLEPVVQAPACRCHDVLADCVEKAQTPEGYLLTIPRFGGGDGHFCARMRRGATS